MTRILSAAVMLPVLWAMIKVAHPLWFAVAALLLIPLACWELYRMLEGQGARPFTWLGLLAGAAVVWSFTGYDPRIPLQVPLLLLLVSSVLLAFWRRNDPAEMFDTVRNTLFPVLLVALCLGYLVGLRMMPGDDGPDLLILLFLCVILGDSFAFYVGSTIGRRPLAPRLSPKKSWEGALGAIVGSCSAALIAHVWFYQRLPISHALVLGVILALAGIFGDLAESMVKRALRVKDSSNLIPGHGGLLDRTDSLLFAAPLLYYYYRAFLLGAV